MPGCLLSSLLNEAWMLFSDRLVSGLRLVPLSRCVYAKAVSGQSPRLVKHAAIGIHPSDTATQSDAVLVPQTCATVIQVGWFQSGNSAICKSSAAMELSLPVCHSLCCLLLLLACHLPSGPGVAHRAAQSCSHPVWLLTSWGPWPA